MTQSAQQAQSKERSTYIVKTWRQSKALILLITAMTSWQHADFRRPVADYFFMDSYILKLSMDITDQESMDIIGSEYQRNYL